MGWIAEKIKEFICNVDPYHVGAFIADVFELVVLAVLFGMVMKLFWKTKKLQNEIERYHPNE